MTCQIWAEHWDRQKICLRESFLLALTEFNSLQIIYQGSKKVPGVQRNLQSKAEEWFLYHCVVKKWSHIHKLPLLWILMLIFTDLENQVSCVNPSWSVHPGSPVMLKKPTCLQKAVVKRAAFLKDGGVLVDEVKLYHSLICQSILCYFWSFTLATPSPDSVGSTADPRGTDGEQQEVKRNMAPCATPCCCRAVLAIS